MYLIYKEVCRNVISIINYDPGKLGAELSFGMRFWFSIPGTHENRASLSPPPPTTTIPSPSSLPSSHPALPLLRCLFLLQSLAVVAMRCNLVPPHSSVLLLNGKSSPHLPFLINFTFLNFSHSNIFLEYLSVLCSTCWYFDLPSIYSCLLHFISWHWEKSHVSTSWYLGSLTPY